MQMDDVVVDSVPNIANLFARYFRSVFSSDFQYFFEYNLSKSMHNISLNELDV